MELLIWIILGLVTWFVISHFLGNPTFWAETRKNPTLAWRYISSQSEWFIGEKPSDIDVVGPFRIVNPNNGQLTIIWCEATKIKKSQRDFIEIIKANR